MIKASRLKRWSREKKPRKEKKRFVGISRHQAKSLYPSMAGTDIIQRLDMDLTRIADMDSRYR